MPAKKVNSVSSQLGGIFASFVFLAVGTGVFLKAQSFSFDNTVFMFKKAIPAAFVSWFLGYATGKIFEGAKFTQGKNVSFSKDKDLVLDDILFEDIKDDEVNE